MKKYNFALNILIFAIIPRVALIILTLFIFKPTFSEYVLARDGKGYLNLSSAFASWNFSTVDYYDVRLFPGYPIIISLFGKIIGFGTSAIFVSLLCTFISCYLYFIIFKDKKTAMFFFFLPPAWFLNTSLVGTEALSMAVILGSLYFFVSGRYKSALTIAVFGIIVKPVILFLFIIYLFLLIKDRHYKTALYGSSLFIVLCICYFIFYKMAFKEMFINYNEYKRALDYSGKKIFSFPYLDIFTNILYSYRLPYQVPLWKKIYILSNVIFFVIALFFVIRLFKVQRDRLSTITLLWCFIIFFFAGSIGGWSGFHCYDRYILPAVPFLFYSTKEIFPKGKIFLSVAFATSFFCALIGNMHGLHLY